jgi:hypothetical protein
MTLLASIKNLIMSHKSDAKPEDPVTFRSYGDDMRFLEIWAKQPIQQLIAGSNITLTPTSGRATDAEGNGPNPITISASSGSGGYASLTGPGQTVTPGELTQEGQFVIQNNTTPQLVVETSSNIGLAAWSTGGATFIAPIASGVFPSTGDFHVETGGKLLITCSDQSSIQTIHTNDTFTIECGNLAIIFPTGTGTQFILIGGITGPLNTQVVQIHALNNSNLWLSFWGATGTSQQTVTGSRGGNAALASLLTALNAYGLIVDASTP